LYTSTLQLQASHRQDPPLLSVPWEKIYDGWYNHVKGVNPCHILGIYDVVRCDTAWLD
jgi:hypothetical protein